VQAIDGNSRHIEFLYSGVVIVAEKSVSSRPSVARQSARVTAFISESNQRKTYIK